MTDFIINDPATLAEVQAVFQEYEKALITNDVETLDRLFWDSPHTLRYGVGENLYGYQEIKAFRAARPNQGLARKLLRTSITTYGKNMACANVEFQREGGNKTGRQSQTWVKFEQGWRVVSAHVSLVL